MITRSVGTRVSRAEQRRETRHNLRLRSTFEWADAEGIVHMAQGCTRDICAKGMFICTDSHPPLKTDVCIEVLLSPDQEIRQDSQLRIRASALVVRVDPIAPGTKGGFAVLHKSYALLRGEVDLKD